MKRHVLKRTHWVALTLLSLGLTACGGSYDAGYEDSPPPVAANDVPASATASATAYTAFAAGLPKSETAKGLDISKTTPPTTETGAPQTI